MLAYIVVTTANYFGRTDAHGKWSAPNLPSGKFRVRIWHPLLNEATDIERLVESGTANESLEIRLSKTLRPAPLTGRPHSWDY